MPTLSPAERQFITQLVAGQVWLKSIWSSEMKLTCNFRVRNLWSEVQAVSASRTQALSLPLTWLGYPIIDIFHMNSFNWCFVICLPSTQFTQVQLALAEQQSQLPMTARATVSGIIPDPDLTQVGGAVVWMWPHALYVSFFKLSNQLPLSVQEPGSSLASSASQRRTIEDLLTGPSPPCQVWDFAPNFY